MIALWGGSLLSGVTFTIAMLATGEIGWLVVGWFAIPITALVWPAILGAWWSPWFYVVVVLGGGVAAWADD